MCKDPQTSYDIPVFKFSVHVLGFITNKIEEEPQIQDYLCQYPHVFLIMPSLRDAIHPYKAHQLSLNPAYKQHKSNDSFGAFGQNTATEQLKLNIDSFSGSVNTEYEAPDQNIQDKILFILNNLSTQNIEEKVTELNPYLQKQTYHQWFSHYLVVKRASIEQNYHELYRCLIESINNNQLSKKILEETVKNIMTLINSPNILESFTEKNLLKSLGNWLGAITLARNRPILLKLISLKNVLIESYHRDHITVSIPFVCKMLLQGDKGKIFKPPNPWLMKLIQLLVEFYKLKDLKTNTIFEIELLCKEFLLDPNDIIPTNHLSENLALAANLIPPNATNSLTANSSVYNPKVSPQVGSDMTFTASDNTLHSMQNSQSSLTNPDVATQMEMLVTPSVAEIAPHVTFNPSISYFTNQTGVKELITTAIERTIKKVAPHITERSVAISGTLTRDLIIKDFAMEPNEERLRKASQLMGPTLAAFYTQATSKDSIKSCMTEQINMLMVQGGVNEAALPKDEIALVVEENVDLCVAAIQRITAEISANQMLELLSVPYHNRKRYRERTGQPYYDMAVFSTTTYPQNLSDSLRLKPSGLTAKQLLVYQEFVHLPTTSSNALAYLSDNPVQSHANENMEGEAAPFDTQQTYVFLQSSFDRFNMLMNELSYRIDQLNEEIRVGSNSPQYNSLQNHIRSLIKQITLVAIKGSQNSAMNIMLANNPNAEARNLTPNEELIQNQRDEIAFVFGQKIVQKLFLVESVIGREVYVLLLMHICDCSLKVKNEIIDWCLYADEERKWNLSVMVALIQIGLLPVDLLDAQLKKLIINLAISNDTDEATLSRLELIVIFSLNLIRVLLSLDEFSEGGNRLDPICKPKQLANLINMFWACHENLYIQPSSLPTIPNICNKTTSKSHESIKKIMLELNQFYPSFLDEIDRVFSNGHEDVQNLHVVANNATIEIVRDLENGEDNSKGRLSKLFIEWVKECCNHSSLTCHPITNFVYDKEKGLIDFINELKESNSFQDDVFFKVAIDISIQVYDKHGLKTDNSSKLNHWKIVLAYQAVDSFTKLIGMLIHLKIDEKITNGNSNEIVLECLSLVKTNLKLICDSIIKQHNLYSENSGTVFNPKAYLRFFSSLLIALHRLGVVHSNPNPSQEFYKSIYPILLKEIASCFLALTPCNLPGFSFCWLTLVSHRNFLPNLNGLENGFGKRIIIQILVTLFENMSKILDLATEKYNTTGGYGTMMDSHYQFYQGVLKLVLMIYHDDPELLSDYHFLLVNSLPSSLVQLRNLILCAYPARMNIPYPFKANHKIDQLKEIVIPPKTKDFDSIVEILKNQIYLKSTLLKVIDEYLLAPPNDMFPKELCNWFIQNEPFDWKLLHAMILYIGIMGSNPSIMLNKEQIDLANEEYMKRVTNNKLETSNAIKVVQTMFEQFDFEKRQNLIDCICNQLRYPNSHTYYFSSVLLYLFLDTSLGNKEQITKVLLERLIVNNPHPWGLLVTFVELIINSRFGLLDLGFTKLAPEIEKLFQTVSRNITL